MNTANYLLKKLAGAGFTLGLLVVLVLINSNFNLYSLQQELENPIYYFFIYGYGTLISTLVDLLDRRLGINTKSRILLYLSSCYVLFFILTLFEGFELGAIPFVLIAGTIAAGCSLLFLLGEFLAVKYRWHRIIFSVIVPTLFLLLLNVDVSIKENYVDHLEASSYEASFSYFNGQHQIPIRLNTADTITFSIDWAIEQGGYGYHFENESGDIVGTISFPDESHTYTAEEAGAYYITVEGQEASGKVQVKWNVDEFTVEGD